MLQKLILAHVLKSATCLKGNGNKHKLLFYTCFFPWYTLAVAVCACNIWGFIGLLVMECALGRDTNECAGCRMLTCTHDLQ